MHELITYATDNYINPSTFLLANYKNIAQNKKVLLPWAASWVNMHD